jgi:hypothetical protein
MGSFTEGGWTRMAWNGTITVACPAGRLPERFTMSAGKGSLPKLMLTKRIASEVMTLRCSACDQLFAAPPVPRGARPWTADEATAKLAAEFSEHVEKVHFPSRPEEREQ